MDDVSATFTPELLTQEYKWVRSPLAYYLPEFSYIDKNWYIIISDETKVYYNDPEINRHHNGSRISGTAVVMKSTAFSVTMTCSPLKVNRRFGGTSRLNLHGWRKSRTRNQHGEESKQMETNCSPETSVHFQRTTWHYIPEDRTLHPNGISLTCHGRKHQVLIRNKELLIASSDHEDAVNQEYAPQCDSVNKHFCLGVSRCIHDAVNSPRSWNVTMNVHLSTQPSLYGEGRN
jgi:hypothetical protein